VAGDRRRAAAQGAGIEAMMKKTLVLIGLLAAVMVAVVGVAAGPSEAHGRVFIGVGVGPFWGWGYPGPYWGYRYAYPYPAPYPSPVVAEERTYIEQQPPPAPAAPAEDVYWYYCPGSRQYYPNVPNCSEAWVRVPARPQQ